MTDSHRTRVCLTRGRFSFELEGSEEFVSNNLNQFLSLLSAPAPDEAAIDVSDSSNGRAADGGDDDPDDLRDRPASDSASGKTSLKSFITEKKPQNASEAIACVLFFYRKVHGRDELSTNEIRSGLVTSRYRPPTNMSQAMTDCRRKYGYISSGTKKGLWKVSHEGEVAVDIDLPRS